MSKEDVHIVPENNQWAIKVEKENQPKKTALTQKDAIKLGRELAKSSRSELIIHGRDGRIKEKNTYGKDPRKIKG
jgi:hypothetical protein